MKVGDKFTIPESARECIENDWGDADNWVGETVTIIGPYTGRSDYDWDIERDDGETMWVNEEHLTSASDEITKVTRFEFRDGLYETREDAVAAELRYIKRRLRRLGYSMRDLKRDRDLLLRVL